MIDEIKLIEELNDYMLQVYGCEIDEVYEYQSKNENDKCSYIVEGLIEAFGIINNQPKVNEWIPCSERLPENRKTVLVTSYWHETYQVMMASYYGEGLWWCVPFNNCGEHMQKLNPKAWMPLPYKYEG